MSTATKPRTSECTNCHQQKTWAQYFTEDCPEGDLLKGVGHVFETEPQADPPPTHCEMDACDQPLVDLGVQCNVDGAMLSVCHGCWDKLVQMTIRGTTL